jgi:hypothetical protein
MVLERLNVTLGRERLISDETARIPHFGDDVMSGQGRLRHH